MSENSWLEYIVTLLKEKMNLNKKPLVEAGPLKINSIIDE